ncbi:MAG TPA: hypothetical protein VFT71_08435 [Candidatus Nitrosocosmicus sp.]|nr:hypothetical protein [Candidatus Nitrosocosmicus sp.]
MILNSISFRKIMNIPDMQFKRFNFYSKTLTLAVSIIAMAFLFSFSNAMEKGVLITGQDVNAQSEQQQQLIDDGNSSYPVTIKLDSVTFAPLTDSHINQLKVDITYQTNDPSLVNTIMAGIMKVYTADGSLIKTSTIPSGYVLGQSGPMQFATSFEDQAIQDVKAEIAMTDTSHVERISNIVNVEATLEK